MAERDLKPTPKIAATGITGAVATVLIVIAKEFGLDLSPEAAAGLVFLATTGAGYLKKDRKP
jgi:uncharacterized protein (DUF697 family)